MIPESREVNREGRAEMDFGIDCDETVVVLDDRVGSGKSETVALRLGRKIRIEDPLEAIFRHADTFVANGDANIVARGQVCYLG